MPAGSDRSGGDRVGRGGGRRDGVGDWIRSTDVFNWIILVGLVLLASILLARFPLVLFVLSLALLITGGLKMRNQSEKWGIAIFVAGFVLFPFGALADPGLLLRNG